MGKILPMFVRVGGALHSVLVEEEACGEGGSDYLHFMFRLFVLRRYRLEVFQRLVPAIPPIGTPSWTEISRLLEDMLAAGEKLFPHQFRPTTLRSYRDEGGQLHHCGTMARGAREVLTLQLLYRALPAGEIQHFAAAACPRSFGDMYDKLKLNLDYFVQGVYGDYGIKLMLDLLVLMSGVPPAAISRWPTDCPGYRRELAIIFPGLHPAEHLQALYWVHRELGKTWRFQFPESCAQLCWHHRRESGVLDDAMDVGGRGRAG